MNKSVRINKFIADSGLTSRRKAEQFILDGKVKINGKIQKELGIKVNPSEDVVEVDGNILDTQTVSPIYIVFHKPKSVMTTVSDPEGRPTVLDYIREVSERIYPVGRLDFDSEGLLILTNDGDFANSVIHPSKRIEKIYEVKVFGLVTPALVRKMMNGVQTDVGFLKPESVRVIGQLERKTWLEFRLIEGKNREIRRLCEAFELTIDKLKRVAIGNLTLDDIAPGKYRFYTKRRIEELLGVRANDEKDFLSSYRSVKKTIRIKTRRIDGVRVKPANDQFFKVLKEHGYKMEKTEPTEVQKSTT